MLRVRVCRRRAALCAVTVLCALAGMLAGVKFAGPATYDTELGQVQVQLSAQLPTRGGLDLYVPLADWGLRAHVISAPVLISAEPRKLRRDRLVDAVAGDSDLLHRQRSQLTSVATRVAVRGVLAALGGALIGGLLALLVCERLGVRGRRLALVPAGSVAVALTVCATVGVWAWATWTPDRLQQPVFYASGSELEGILSDADDLRRSGLRYRSQVEGAIRAVAGMLDQGRRPAAPAARRWLLASDLHNNALVTKPLARFGRGRPVVLAGDFTHNGSEVETKLLDGIEHTGRPVLAVSGNHDSRALMNLLASKGVTVLTHAGRLSGDGSVSGPDVITVDGMDVAGFEDPFEYAGRKFPSEIRAGLSFTDFPDGRDQYEAAVEQAWSWWKGLSRRPDVLIMHEAALAREIAHRIWKADPAGAPVTILSGHTHKQRLDVIGPVTVVDSGTVGAGGPFGAGKDQIGLALLDFSARRLDAADLVQMNPRDGAAQARRIITARPDCDRKLVFCPETPKATNYRTQVRRWRKKGRAQLSRVARIPSLATLQSRPLG